METIGFVRSDLGLLVGHLEELRGSLEWSRSRSAPGRRELWLRRRWVGSSFVVAAECPQLSALGDRLLPGWGVCAVFLGMGIAPHRDHSIFGRRVVSVNLAPALLRVDADSWELAAGQIVAFDSKKLHSVECADLRWSVCFWDLPLISGQLSLF